MAQGAHPIRGIPVARPRASQSTPRFCLLDLRALCSRSLRGLAKAGVMPRKLALARWPRGASRKARSNHMFGVSARAWSTNGRGEIQRRERILQLPPGRARHPVTGPNRLPRYPTHPAARQKAVRRGPCLPAGTGGEDMRTLVNPDTSDERARQAGSDRGTWVVGDQAGGSISPRFRRPVPKTACRMLTASFDPLGYRFWTQMTHPGASVIQAEGCGG